MDYFTLLFNDGSIYVGCVQVLVGLMDEVEYDEEYLIARARLEHKKVSMHKEDLYMARVRVLVIDQKKSNSEARRMAFEEII